jgi:hypothetical protein
MRGGSGKGRKMRQMEREEEGDGKNGEKREDKCPSSEVLLYEPHHVRHVIHK